MVDLAARRPARGVAGPARYARRPMTQREPIFIVGMMRRCGTNFLSDALHVHPEVTSRAPIWEDYLLHHAGPLVEFADRVSAAWPADWEVEPGARDELLAELGHGIERFLTARAGGRRVVTKSPRSTNLPRVRELFPTAPVLVLVRDGRDLVESTVRSGFARNHEAAMRDWAAAADEVLAADLRLRDDPAYLLVRFEDLFDDLPGVMARVLEVCGLDPAGWDAGAAAALPVRGSSSVAVERGQVDWQPREKTADFRPTARWESWDDHLHRRFAGVAGRQQEALGYQLADPGPPSPGERVRSAADGALWFLQRQRRRIRRVGRAVGESLG